MLYDSLFFEWLEISKCVNKYVPDPGADSFMTVFEQILCSHNI